MPSTKDSAYTYLALGDSYTIGENVQPHESFPYQVIELLTKEGFNFNSPDIIAKTGWTTDELQVSINKYKLLPSYDFVTLLIGVNNQYQGRRVENYKPEFESLLKQAIRFAGDKAMHVIVLSIPDWGATPFAAGRDKYQIAIEIDAYNAVNKSLAKRYKTQYIEITSGTRNHAGDLSFITTDGLHPSGKEYAGWAVKISGIVKKLMKDE